LRKRLVSILSRRPVTAASGLQIVNYKIGEELPQPFCEAFFFAEDTDLPLIFLLEAFQHAKCPFLTVGVQGEERLVKEEETPFRCGANAQCEAGCEQKGIACPLGKVIQGPRCASRIVDGDRSTVQISDSDLPGLGEDFAEQGADVPRKAEEDGARVTFNLSEYLRRARTRLAHKLKIRNLPLTVEDVPFHLDDPLRDIGERTLHNPPAF
jgi:hypothetical protein